MADQTLQFLDSLLILVNRGLLRKDFVSLLDVLFFSMRDRDWMNAIRPSDLTDGFLSALGFHDHLEFEPPRVPFAVLL
jgi:hypothetical protein